MTLYDPNDIPQELRQYFDEVEVVCGAPWARCVEAEKHPRGDSFGCKDVGDYDHGQAGTPYMVTIKTTTGWAPTCAHDAPTVPAIVLDPFAGSGTTGAVARLHGRRFVGLDLNATYLRTLALPRAEGRNTAAALAELPLFAL